MPQDNWSDEVARTIGRQVRRYRDHAGVSAQRLADALTELGVPMERSVLAGLENGRRRTVSVAELIAFAKVLNVAPLALIYPLEESSLVEVVPGSVADAYVASKWFAGDAPFPETPEEIGEVELWAWDGDVSALSQLRKHDREMQVALTTVAALRKTANLGPFNVIGPLGQLAEELEKRVKDERKKLAGSGTIPPPLPSGMEYIDEGIAPATPTDLLDVALVDDENKEAFIRQAEKVIEGMEHFVKLERRGRGIPGGRMITEWWKDIHRDDENSASGDRETPPDGA